MICIADMKVHFNLSTTEKKNYFVEEERTVVFIRRSEGPPFITTIYLRMQQLLKKYFKNYKLQIYPRFTKLFYCLHGVTHNSRISSFEYASLLSGISNR
jgi:hypothetical protein